MESALETKEAKEYLTKYRKIYRLERKESDFEGFEYTIKCRSSKIELYSFESGKESQTLVYFSEKGLSKKWISMRIKRIKALRIEDLRFHQVSYESFALIFDESKLKELEIVLGIRRKRQFSQKSLMIMRERMIEARKSLENRPLIEKKQRDGEGTS